MEVNVKVTVELGPQTMGLLTNGFAAQTAPVKSVSREDSKPEVEDKPKAPAKAEKPAPVKKVEEKTKPADFEDLDEDAKREAIKTEITKHTKKGKSGDIKALLGHFDAGRGSELSTEVLDEFYQFLKRYGAGESVEAITGGGEDLA